MIAVGQDSSEENSEWNGSCSLPHLLTPLFLTSSSSLRWTVHFSSLDFLSFSDIILEIFLAPGRIKEPTNYGAIPNFLLPL